MPQTTHPSPVACHPTPIVRRKHRSLDAARRLSRQTSRRNQQPQGPSVRLGICHHHTHADHIQLVMDHQHFYVRVNARSTLWTILSVRLPCIVTAEALLNVNTDNSSSIVEAIWPLSSVPCREDTSAKGVLPLRTFIQETLRRSRTSYSTLQVALYYLILIKPHVPSHDFTMEQPRDGASTRALQCGRRMFLAALILASKYLQDRNYSARAWSKISGLQTTEINQNELSFLLAIKWRLHITELTFQRWTDIVLKYTPQQPSIGGTTPRMTEQTGEWKSIILRLNPELDNIDAIAPARPTRMTRLCSPASPLTPMVAERYNYASADATPTPAHYIPTTLEPSPITSYPMTKPAPALGLLPTPRLTPQIAAVSMPAASATSCSSTQNMVRPSMGAALGSYQALAQNTSEQWAPATSPSSYSGRRSPLANSVSLTSSPESMVSDHGSTTTTLSQVSRSSSVSSATSLAPSCTQTPAKLDVLARCRHAKLRSEQPEVRSYPRIVLAPSAHELTGSPDVYLSMPGAEDADKDAARVLQNLQAHLRPGLSRAGSKRTRANSSSSTSSSLSSSECGGSVPLQDEVRGLLWGWSPERSSVRFNEMDSPRKKLCSAVSAPVGTDIGSHSGGVGLGLRVNGLVLPGLAEPAGSARWQGMLH